MNRRPIKFRGLNEENREWVYGYYTKLVEGIRRFDAIISDIDGELTRFYIHSPETIGQYTGLKDKNGKEIYEGDVGIVYNFEDRGDGYKDPYIGKVAWSNDYCGFLWIGGSYSSDYTMEELILEIEIIGNIHENKELLDEL